MEMLTYYIFTTEEEAIKAEAIISLGLGLPSELGERWDIPELRQFEGGIKWSIIPNELFDGIIDGAITSVSNFG
jgi:hypothetical protein